jgi:hypothetical protein
VLKAKQLSCAKSLLMVPMSTWVMGLDQALTPVAHHDDHPLCHEPILVAVSIGRPHFLCSMTLNSFMLQCSFLVFYLNF